MVTANSDEQFDAVRDAVVEANVSLRALQPRELTLEDVYIRTVSGLGAPVEIEDRVVAGGN